MAGSSLTRATVGVLALAAAIVLGILVLVFGGITCHEEMQSSDQAPNLCRSVGTGAGLWLPPTLSVVVALMLLVFGARARTLAIAAAAIVLVEGGLVLMWALVSHGTIHY